MEAAVPADVSQKIIVSSELRQGYVRFFLRIMAPSLYKGKGRRYRIDGRFLPSAFLFRKMTLFSPPPQYYR